MQESPTDVKEQRARGHKRLPHKLRFTKVYNKGWETLGKIAENAMAMKVYAFLARNADHHNAVICSVELMAEELEVHERTIMRATKWLHDNLHLTIEKIATANVYILNCDDLWKTYEEHKRYCGVSARALLKKSPAQKRRIKKVVEAQGDLFVGETSEEDEAA